MTERRLKILHVGALPPPYGGLEVLVDVLVNAPQMQSMHTNRVINMSRGEIYRRRASARFGFEGLIRRVRIAWGIAREIRSFCPDIVHYHVGRADWSFLSDAFNLWLAHLMGSHVIAHFHSAPEQSMLQSQSVFPGRRRLTQTFFAVAMLAVDR